MIDGTFESVYGVRDRRLSMIAKAHSQSPLELAVNRFG